MSMKIYKELNLFEKVLLALLEVAYNADDFRKELWPMSFLVDVPMAVEVVAEHACTVVAHQYPIDIDHGHQNPVNMGIFSIHQLICETLHQPRTYALPRVLPSKHYSYCFAVLDLV